MTVSIECRIIASIMQYFPISFFNWLFLFLTITYYTPAHNLINFNEIIVAEMGMINDQILAPNKHKHIIKLSQKHRHKSHLQPVRNSILSISPHFNNILQIVDENSPENKAYNNISCILMT